MLHQYYAGLARRIEAKIDTICVCTGTSEIRAVSILSKCVGKISWYKIKEVQTCLEPGNTNWLADVVLVRVTTGLTCVFGGHRKKNMDAPDSLYLFSPKPLAWNNAKEKRVYCKGTIYFSVNSSFKIYWVFFLRQTIDSVTCQHSLNRVFHESGLSSFLCLSTRGGGMAAHPQHPC